MEGGATTAGDPDKLFNEFRADIKKKIENYNEQHSVDTTSEFNTTEELPVGELFFRFANGCDKCLAIIGTVCSIIYGAGMPGFSFFMGEMINGLGDATSGNMDNFKDSSFLMLMLGVVVMFVAWFQITLWSLFAHRVAFKTKMAYFASTLRQDAAYYDQNNPNEMSAKIAKEVGAI